MRVAVIPARGGSKRIPRKNIRQFGNKPMIAHSLTVAKASGLFEHVLVSTDDEEIAGVARQWGAEVPFERPVELADDYTNTTEVVAHAIRWMRVDGWQMDAVCCIYATAPFLSGEDLARACRLLEGGRWEYVFAATSFGYPIQRALRAAAEWRHADVASRVLGESIARSRGSLPRRGPVLLGSSRTYGNWPSPCFRQSRRQCFYLAGEFRTSTRKKIGSGPKLCSLPCAMWQTECDLNSDPLMMALQSRSIIS